MNNISFEEYCHILRSYSLLGLKFYESLDASRKRKVDGAMNAEIERVEKEVCYKFSEIKKKRMPRKAFKFIAMPECPTRDFDVGFFVPRFNFGNFGNIMCGFDVIFWIDNDSVGECGKRGRTIGFRLEPPDMNTGSAHAYPHVQMSKTIKKPRVETSAAKWVPDSYPAFPVRCWRPSCFWRRSSSPPTATMRAKWRSSHRKSYGKHCRKVAPPTWLERWSGS